MIRSRFGVASKGLPRAVNLFAPTDSKNIITIFGCSLKEVVFEKERP